jgi:hypothetical protein
MTSKKGNFKIELERNREMWQVWITKIAGFVSEAEEENNYEYIAGEFDDKNKARQFFKKAKSNPDQFWK